VHAGGEVVVASGHGGAGQGCKISGVARRQEGGSVVAQHRGHRHHRRHGGGQQGGRATTGRRRRQMRSGQVGWRQHVETRCRMGPGRTRRGTAARRGGSAATTTRYRYRRTTPGSTKFKKLSYLLCEPVELWGEDVPFELFPAPVSILSFGSLDRHIALSKQHDPTSERNRSASTINFSCGWNGCQTS